MMSAVFFGPHNRVPRDAALRAFALRALWRRFRTASAMDTTTPDIRHAHLEALRGEARMLATAGYVLMAVALPLTLLFVALALSGRGGSPFLPIAAGAPPMMIGYMACHYATRRLARAAVLAR